MDALFVRHEPQVGENDKTREEAGETVDSGSHEAVPIRTHPVTISLLRLLMCSGLNIFSSLQTISLQIWISKSCTWSEIISLMCHFYLHFFRSTTMLPVLCVICYNKQLTSESKGSCLAEINIST
jgi:hypothetical protein